MAAMGTSLTVTNRPNPAVHQSPQHELKNVCNVLLAEVAELRIETIPGSVFLPTQLIFYTEQCFKRLS